jgi:hypothetical protein
MDLPALASILSGSFTAPQFRGDPETLYRCLLSRRDFTSLAGCPSNARDFLLKLKEIAPELRALGVDIVVLGTGQLRIRSRADAEAEQAEESRLRAAFFSSSSADAAAIRREFGGNSEDAFQRWMAYKRGVAAGRIKPPITHAVVEANSATAIDPRPVEEQCKSRWALDAKVRREFHENFDAYVAFEKASANGQVRIRKIG